MRGRDGSVVPYLVAAGTDDKAVVLSEDPSSRPTPARRRSAFAFGVGEDWALSARVISGPRGDLVEITAGEDSRVHVN